MLIGLIGHVAQRERSANFKLRSGFSTANQINFDLQLSDLQSFS